MVDVAVASSLRLVLILHVTTFDLRAPFSESIKQLFDQSTTMFAEAAIVDGWEYGSLIDKFFDHNHPGVINVAALIGLDLPLGIDDHLISDLDLLTELTKLHLLDLKLQLSLLLLPLELEVLDQDDVFFEYVSKEFTGELLVPGLLPFPWELISTFHQGYHLSVVVIKLCLEFTQLCVGLINLLLE